MMVVKSAKSCWLSIELRRNLSTDPFVDVFGGRRCRCCCRREASLDPTLLRGHLQHSLAQQHKYNRLHPPPHHTIIRPHRIQDPLLNLILSTWTPSQASARTSRMSLPLCPYLASCTRHQTDFDPQNMIQHALTMVTERPLGQRWRELNR